ncbi:hypothetical protein HCJ93_11730 [Streptomyces sp. SBST2-5]|uniref:Gram-positive cocci surface proteins LPxTG domain-containing protein n=1 Tax=Streptomyces composti TaxID=2720025 RepID=A0ABX1A6V0_9ACTN|nr:hypothetical protein [Streptomyces composti]NJP50722.1 hypothetical protein [Streptomyces composti]
MRPPTALPFRPAATAALLVTLATAAPALSTPAQAAPLAPLPSCAGDDERGFPLTTRLHGGPRSYTAGGGHGTWRLSLTNTTDRTCTHIHPVIVLVDEAHALRPAQTVMEFHDDKGRPHPVRFVRTEEDELIGALADDRGGFRGFTVRPDRTVDVRLRLAITSGAVANEVTANAAVVQRRGQDGEWVGQSNDYRFRIAGREPATPRPPGETGDSGASERPAASADATGAPREPAGPAETGRPADTASAGAATSAATSTPTPPPPFDRIPFADELARTGRGRTMLALAGAALLVLAGTGAVLLARRLPGRR